MRLNYNDLIRDLGPHKVSVLEGKWDPIFQGNLGCCFFLPVFVMSFVMYCKDASIQSEKTMSTQVLLAFYHVPLHLEDNI